MPLTVNDDTSLLDGNGNQVEFVDGDGNAVEVGFTTDDWNIYTFANGELISTVNHWGGEHYWTSWDGTEYKNVDMGFHFHDQNWNSIANSGSHDSYRFDEDGELVHIQTSSHSGFTITEGIDAEGGPLSLLIEKGVDTLLTDIEIGDDTYSFADISEVRLEQRSFEGLAAHNPHNEEYFEPWEDDSEVYEFFVPVSDDGHVERLGRAEVRNGFIEVYDPNWQQLGRLLAGDGATAETIDAQFLVF